jgi:alkaline phosphatase D
VASGDPLPDGVVLWTRITPRDLDAVGVRWRVARDPDLRDVVVSGHAVADPAADWTVRVDPRGLAPATTYWYGFTAYGQDSPVGRTRTAPAGRAERLRLAAVSCSSYAAGFFNAYARLADRDDLDLVVHLGDYIYESGGASTRVHEPAREIVTLQDYRTRYAQYRTDPDLQRAHAAHPWVLVWDDHESANNSWKDGAGGHQPATEGRWEDRKRAATQAYAEWMPIRLPDPADPGRIYRRLSFGGLLDLVMVDTRLQRRQPETPAGTFGTGSDDPARTMLGPDQKAWLLDTLASSTATWRFLGNQTMISPHSNNPTQPALPYLPEEVVEASGTRKGGGNEGSDNWGAYRVERDEVINALRGAGDTVVLTGDIHTAWGCDVVEDPLDATRYDRLTGRGSAAVELVCTSVTSHNLQEALPEAAPALNAAVLAGNPNVLHVDLSGHGYVLADITPDRVLAQWWKTGTARQRSSTETLSTELVCAKGTRHLTRVL